MCIRVGIIASTLVLLESLRFSNARVRVQTAERSQSLSVKVHTPVCVHKRVETVCNYQPRGIDPTGLLRSERE